MADLKEKLEKEIQQVEWEQLKPHQEREALVMVSQELPLVDVALAFAEDDTKNVKKWMSQNLVYKPSATEMSRHPSQKNFKFVIVQPFVLIQELAN
ncbi:MAG: DUF2288 domain-containing protein [Bdellovibrionales bacterium]|nr:DUF2288 domain-containing protein [Bdellovibrionales bacterium]